MRRYFRVREPMGLRYGPRAGLTSGEESAINAKLYILSTIESLPYKIECETELLRCPRGCRIVSQGLELGVCHTLRLNGLISSFYFTTNGTKQDHMVGIKAIQLKRFVPSNVHLRAHDTTRPVPLLWEVPRILSRFRLYRLPSCS